jgi:hypothetical protein
LESGDAIERVKVATNSRFLPMGGISHDCLVCVVDMDMDDGQPYLLDLTSGVISILPTPSQGFTDTFYNIGRVASTGEHKLLAVTFGQQHAHAQQVCNILTLGDDEGGWRDTGHPPLNVEWQTRGCAVINGIAYFLPGYPVDSMEIMAFDFKSEEWRPLAPSLPGPAGKHSCA